MMDADTPSRRPPVPAAGGTVEPANRATVAKERFQTPEETEGKHYEMRDPFAEVTYRARSFDEMVAKAEQLGSSRFVAVADDGARTLVQKVDGRWPREAEPGSRSAPAERTAGRTTEGVETPDRLKSEPATKAARMQQAVRTDPADAQASARIDAQAERAALVARLEAALQERYLIKRAPVTVGDLTVGRIEYRFRGDTTRVAFTESTFRLATDTNSPSVARSMVDVAEARNWRALRVSGNEDFKRLVWLEASVRGVKTLGYEPNPADLEVLKRERDGRLVNRIEPMREASDQSGDPAAQKAAGRGGGRKAVLAAIEAVLVARQVPELQRAAVMAAASEKLAQRLRDGQAPKIKVYDRTAPSQRTVTVPTPEVQRSRDRTPSAPVR